jgi:hypothetical protein
MPSFDDFMVFVDESGDHGMTSIDPNYPMFVLAFCLADKTEYAELITSSVLKFKFKHFGHDQIILHERDIRKAQGEFRFLQNPARRIPFFDDLNDLIEFCPLKIIASAIRKLDLQRLYSIPDNPYHMAMGFGLERLFLHLNGQGCRTGTTHILFESRGKKEDIDLELEFRRICARNATGQTLPFEIVIADKKSNSSGLQLADLVARPIGRKILDPQQPNRAYDILERKLRRNNRGIVDGWGLKVFP